MRQHIRPHHARPFRAQPSTRIGSRAMLDDIAAHIRLGDQAHGVEAAAHYDTALWRLQCVARDLTRAINREAPRSDRPA